MVLLLTAKAQYHSIFGKNSTAWNVYELGIGYYITDSVYTSGIDTNYNGHLYKDIGGILIRDDTTTGSIFMTILGYNTEFETMNMTLNIGDSFCFAPGFDTCYNNTYHTVDSVFIDSLGRKNIQFDFILNFQMLPPIPPLPLVKWKFIEGVGPNDRGGREIGGSLLCSYKDGVRVFTNEFGSSCFVSNIGVEENALEKILVYPNPSTNILQIILPSPQHTGYKFFNLSGEILLTGELTNNKKIDVSYLPKGVYFMEFTNAKNKHYVKLIKQ